MRSNTSRNRTASTAQPVVVSITFTLVLAIGTIGGALVGRSTAPGAAWAESDPRTCEHNRCRDGKMCVDSEAAATQCDAIGQRGECITLPCGANGVTINNLVRSLSSENADQLVELGPGAANAVLGYASLPEPYAGRSRAVEILARMVEAWQAESFDKQDLNRLHELALLYLGPSPRYLDVDERVPVAVGAIGLALALNDLELRSVVERIASSREEARARVGSQADYGRLTEYARSRLGLDSSPGANRP